MTPERPAASVRASLIDAFYRVRNFPILYRIARNGAAKDRGRRAALSATLSIGYGIRLKRFWRIGALAKFLRSRRAITPDRSRWWVVRMWWRYV